MNEQLIRVRHPEMAQNRYVYKYVYVNKRHGFLYNRIKKNANSVVMMYFHSQHGRGVVPNDHDAINLAKERLPHLNNTLLLTDPATLRRMVVLRNPYDRLLSAFLDKFRDGSDFHERYRPFEISNDGFSSFISWLEDGGINKNGHWNLQSSLLAFPIDFYTDFIDCKRLKTELPAFLNSVGMDGNQFGHHENASSGKMNATKSQSVADRYWSDDLRDRVFKLYESDFAMYRRHCGNQSA